MTRFPVLLSLLSAVVLTSCAPEVDGLGQGEGENLGEVGADGHPGGIGKIHAKGGVTCDFSIHGDAFGPTQIAPALERDRMIMSRQDGIVRKHLPLALDLDHASGGQPDLFSGGRYLFQKAKDAVDYLQFVENEYSLDGVKFFDRPYFYGHECHAFEVVGAHDFSDLHDTHAVIRVERFQMSGLDPVKRLKMAWPAVKQEAQSRRVASVWLGYDEAEGLATVVYVNDRVVPQDPAAPDFASLGYLAGAAPLGHHLEELGFIRTFDRTHWVLTSWLPFKDGDHGEPSVWPNSPPFGQPSCGDQVCEVSRGESRSTCAADCPWHCGNGVCRPWQGENDLNCPGDCGG